MQLIQERERIVDALEESPEPDAVAVKPVVCPILDRRDPSDDRISAPREKQLAVGIGVEGILRAVESIVDRRAKRRDPGREAPLVEQPPGQINEPAQVAAAGDGNDVD